MEVIQFQFTQFTNKLGVQVIASTLTEEHWNILTGVENRLFTKDGPINGCSVLIVDGAPNFIKKQFMIELDSLFSELDKTKRAKREQTLDGTRTEIIGYRLLDD